MWIQIKCLESIRLHKFALNGRSSGANLILNWKLEASSDGIIWATLYSSTKTCLTYEVWLFAPTISPFASYYKFFIIEAKGLAPGLSYMQLFIYDLIEFPFLAKIVATD